jgi:hypothetical protein
MLQHEPAGRPLDGRQIGKAHVNAGFQQSGQKLDAKRPRIHTLDDWKIGG